VRQFGQPSRDLEPTTGKALPCPGEPDHHDQPDNGSSEDAQHGIVLPAGCPACGCADDHEHDWDQTADGQHATSVNLHRRAARDGMVIGRMAGTDTRAHTITPKILARLAGPVAPIAGSTGSLSPGPAGSVRLCAKGVQAGLGSAKDQCMHVVRAFIGVDGF
jgi:hypothetical protein